jgi:hypothetical protein
MATLTVTVTEAVTLGDGSTDRGTTNTQTISVNEVDHRIMDLGSGYADVLRFAATASAGTFKDASVKYLRITNLDDTAFITLRVRTADSQYFVKVESKDHFIIGNNEMDAMEDGDTALTESETFVKIDAIAAKSSVSGTQIEYFIACED